MLRCPPGAAESGEAGPDGAPPGEAQPGLDGLSSEPLTTQQNNMAAPSCHVRAQSAAARELSL